MIITQTYDITVCIDMIPTNAGDDCNLCSEDNRYNISQEEICQMPWKNQFGNQSYPDPNINHHVCNYVEKGIRKKHCMATCGNCGNLTIK